MTLKVVCDDCGTIEDAHETRYDGGVIRPSGWEQIGTRSGRYTFAIDAKGEVNP